MNVHTCPTPHPQCSIYFMCNCMWTFIHASPHPTPQPTLHPHNSHLCFVWLPSQRRLNSLDDFSGFCVLVFLDTLVFGGFQCHKQFLQKSSGEKVDLLVDLAFKTVHGQNVVAGHLWTRCAAEVNYLSHFLLTNLLLPTLRASSPARIVNVACQEGTDKATWRL